MIFDNGFTIVLFYFFYNLDTEIACYVQYTPKTGIGRFLNAFVFSAFLLVAVILVKVIRPIMDQKDAVAFAKWFAETYPFRADGEDGSRAKGPVHMLHVGSGDGFLTTKLAANLIARTTEAATAATAQSFHILCLDDYGERGGLTEAAFMRNAEGTGVSRSVEVINAAGYGGLGCQRRILPSSVCEPGAANARAVNLAVLQQSGLRKSPLLGLEYESDPLASNSRFEMLLLELWSCLKRTNGKVAVICRQSNIKADPRAIARNFVRIIEETGCYRCIEIKEFPVPYQGWFQESVVARTGPSAPVFVVEATAGSKSEFRGSQAFTMRRSVGSSNANKYSRNVIFLEALAVTVVIYTVIVVVTFVEFRNLAVPKNVGLNNYLNYFLLNQVQKFPPGLCFGLFLLFVKFERTEHLSVNEARAAARKFVTAAFVVGLLQDGIAYTFSVVINYYIGFRLLGLPTTGTEVILIDAAILLILLRSLKMLWDTYTKRRQQWMSDGTSKEGQLSAGESFGFPSEGAHNPLVGGDGGQQQGSQ